MSRQARVGLLVILGFVLFAIALFAIANRTFLFSKTFPISATFNQVAGLPLGAAVQYQGVNVGRVEAVQLPENPGGKIQVSMAISENARKVIRKNTEAQIKSDGLVGSQIVVLVSTSATGDPIDDDDVITGVDPFDLFEITDKALVSVQNFERAAVTFEEIMLDVANGQGTLGRIVYDSTLYKSIVSTTEETKRVLNSLATNAEVMVEVAAATTEGISTILNSIESGDGTMAKLLNDPELYNTLIKSADSVQAITGEMYSILENMNNTANWSAVAAFRFAELTEAAKHNWLFKRYFEERGYMEQAPFEIREKAITESQRKIGERERELLEWEQRLQAREDSVSASSRVLGSGNQDQ